MYDQTRFSVREGLYRYAPGELGEEPQFTVLFAAPAETRDIYRSFAEREAFLAYVQQ